MTVLHTPALVAAGAFSFLASAAHLACIAGGGRWYRFMGAGERMANAAERGQWQPTAVTLCIAGVLAMWGLYAWSGAGLLPRLPLLPWALGSIAGVYLARGFLFPVLRSHFPNNSARFWYVSSSICIVIAITHLVGLWQLWRGGGLGAAS